MIHGLWTCKVNWGRKTHPLWVPRLWSSTLQKGESGPTANVHSALLLASGCDMTSCFRWSPCCLDSHPHDNYTWTVSQKQTPSLNGLCLGVLITETQSNQSTHHCFLRLLKYCLELLLMAPCSSYSSARWVKPLNSKQLSSSSCCRLCSSLWCSPFPPTASGQSHQRLLRELRVFFQAQANSSFSPCLAVVIYFTLFCLRKCLRVFKCRRRTRSSVLDFFNLTNFSCF